MARPNRHRRIGVLVAAHWLGLLAFATVPVGVVAGQTEPTAEEVALAGAVRERFDVELRPGGMTLSSTAGDGTARVIALGDGVVAVDGVPVSGFELRELFGPAADLVLRVTYLGDAARRALFGGEDGAAAGPPGSEPAEADPAGEPAPTAQASASAGGQSATVASSAPTDPAPGGEVAVEEQVEAEASAAGDSSVAAEESAEAAPPDEAPVAVEQSTADPGAESTDRSDDAPQIRTTTRGDVTRVGGPVTIERDERVVGDATVILGPLSVDGEVTGDIVVIGGAARFGPQAVVDGDVTVVAGSLRRSPSAALRGSVTQIGPGSVGRYTDAGRWWQVGWPGGGFFGSRDLVGTVMRLFFLALLACGVVLVACGPAERVARRAGAEPLKAGVVGLLAQMLAVPVLVSGILMAVISIVGIPLLLLLPFVAMAAGLIMLLGFSGAVLGAGELVRNRMGASSSAAYASVWAGVALILLPTMAGEALGMVGGFFRGLGVLLALAGFLLEYAAWTTGLGAFILNRFSPAPPAPGAFPSAGLPPFSAPPAPPPSPPPQVVPLPPDPVEALPAPARSDPPPATESPATESPTEAKPDER